MNIQPLNTELNAKQTVIFLNGFLQANDNQFEDWLVSQLRIKPNVMLYGIHWPSKTVGDLGILAHEIYQNRNFWQLINNPWHNVLKTAEKSGAQLGRLLINHQYQNLTLVAHSLGCRVIYYALDTLAKNHCLLAANIILLGGAVGNQSKDWEKVAEHIDGKIYNCFSKEDSMLQYVYSSSLVWLSKPIGRYPIDTTNEKIINIDCTEIVRSHMNWKQQYQNVYHYIFNHK